MSNTENQIEAIEIEDNKSLTLNLNEIQKIHSPCKNCSFAIYEGITQTGCRLNYIEKYRTSGTTVLEAYDDDREFFIINGKKCLGYREDKFFPENSTTQEKIDIFQKNNYIHYLMTISLKNLSSENLIEMGQKIKALSIKPRKLVFVRYQDEDQRHHYFNIEKVLRDSEYEGKWEIKTLLADTPYYNVLHEVMNTNKKYRFVLSVENMGEFANLVTKAQKTVYEDLGQFSSYINTNKSCFLLSAPSYRYCLLIEGKDLFTDEKLQTIVE